MRCGRSARHEQWAPPGSRPVARCSRTSAGAEAAGGGTPHGRRRAECADALAVQGCGSLEMPSIERRTEHPLGECCAPRPRPLGLFRPRVFSPPPRTRGACMAPPPRGAGVVVSVRQQSSPLTLQAGCPAFGFPRLELHSGGQAASVKPGCQCPTEFVFLPVLWIWQKLAIRLADLAN